MSRPETNMSDYVGVPLDKLPNHPPKSVEDLRYGQNEPERLFTLPDYVAQDARLLPLWTALLEAAKAIDIVRVDGTEITRILDGERVAENIEAARARHDLERKRFWQMINGHCEKGYDFSYREYMRLENIKWEKDFDNGYTKSD